MDTIFKIVGPVDFWKIAAPAFVAALVWFLNERSKLSWEQFKRKEENYRALLDSIKGFSMHAMDLQLQNKFVQELNNCWLYAPDSVLEKAYCFLDMGSHIDDHSNDERKIALGNFVAEIRKDLLSRKIVKHTSLQGKDYQWINMVSK